MTAASAPEPPRDHLPTPGLVAGPEPCHVLVVDDSPDHRMLIARSLRGAGHHVSTAGTAEQALGRLAEVDLVLVDQHLPGMSGTQLLGALVALPDAPAAVVVTAQGDPDAILSAMRLGAVDYVVKSRDYLGELPAVVERAHRQHDLARRHHELERFALQLHAPTDPEATVRAIVDTARRLLRARGVGVARRLEDRWQLVGADGEVPAREEVADWLDAQPRGEVVATRDDLVALDLPTDPGQPRGVLLLLAGPRGRFTDGEVALARTFAGFAASALRQAQRLAYERHLVGQLQSSVRARQDFIASVSHELRTPLTVIAGYVETCLERDQLDRTLVRHMLERVLGNAHQLRRLIDQLLDAAAVERGGTQVPAPVDCDLADVVAGAVAEVSFHLEGRPGHREVPSATLVADPVLLHRVLVNLLSNACKYSPRGTAVDVLAEVDDRTVRVVVRDRGPGVAAADRHHVFEPFWRAEHAVAEAIRGTGIGLSLVRAHVEAMGGAVGVDTDTDEVGARFWFRVPRVARQPPTATLASRSPTRAAETPWTPGS